jgi:hypothetical protein
MFSLFNRRDDNDEDCDDILINSEHSSVVKIDALADGSCFIHSILKCSHEDYRQSSTIGERKEIAYDARRYLKDQLRLPNPKYPDLQSVVKFVKNHFFGNDKGQSKETKGIKSKNFFQVCYGFEYISQPVQTKPYYVEYFDNLKEYYDYINEYRSYLIEFDNFLNRKLDTLPIFPELKSKTGNRESIELKPLNKQLSDYIESIKKAQETLSKKVNEVTNELRKILKKGLGDQLYNPQNFGCHYIQSYLRDKPTPKGMYWDVPFNAYFFTANPGMLDRFAYYPERLIPRLEDMERIVDNPMLFLGDMDIVPFIPSIFELNIIVIDFYKNQLINEYSYKDTQDDPWVVISHSGNHYDSCGFKKKVEDSDLIQTVFTIEDPFIQVILKSKENKGKIDWSLMDKKEEIKLLPPTPKRIDIPYEKKTVDELKKIAFERNIRITTTMKKQDIINLLKE